MHRRTFSLVKNTKKPDKNQCWRDQSCQIQISSSFRCQFLSKIKISTKIAKVLVNSNPWLIFSISLHLLILFIGQFEYYFLFIVIVLDFFVTGIVLDFAYCCYSWVLLFAYCSALLLFAYCRGSPHLTCLFAVKIYLLRSFLSCSLSIIFWIYSIYSLLQTIVCIL